MSTQTASSEQPPLFIPLRSEFFEAFCDGSKTVEFRQYGPRWNERTCQIGRRVTLSKGYGKKHRRHGVIVGVEKRYVESPDWIACYGSPGMSCCIQIRLATEVPVDNQSDDMGQNTSSCE